MKKILALVVVVSSFMIAGNLLWRYLQFDELPIMTISKQEEVVKPEPRQEPKPEGALSFWCGEVIIGEDADEGKLELVAHVGRKSVILEEDEEGVFLFDSIRGIEKGEMQIRLQGAGKPPLVFHILVKSAQEMFPVYELTQAVKDGKIGPLILPQVMPPAQQKHRQKGQQIEGPTWHLGSYQTQVYGDVSSR